MNVSSVQLLITWPKLATSILSYNVIDFTDEHGNVKRLNWFSQENVHHFDITFLWNHSKYNCRLCYVYVCSSQPLEWSINDVSIEIFSINMVSVEPELCRMKVVNIYFVIILQF